MRNKREGRKKKLCGHREKWIYRKKKKGALKHDKKAKRKKKLPGR